MYRVIWYFLCRHILVVLNNNTFNKLVFAINCLRLKHKYYHPNYTHPQTFNEKIVYLKNHPQSDIGSILADKVRVREYVEQKIGKQYLIQLYGVYANASEIEFETLPAECVIKTNHGSGWNMIIPDKSKLNWSKACSKLNYWLSLNAWYLNREWQYNNMKPLILVEKLLGTNIFDFKIFCFDGKPQYIQVDIDRFIQHTRSFYDTGWNKQSFGINYPISDTVIEKPEQLNQMLDLAQKLSSDLPFARVDFYISDNEIFFGEITLHPGSGVEPFLSYDQDLMFGKHITI